MGYLTLDSCWVLNSKAIFYLTTQKGCRKKARNRENYPILEIEHAVKVSELIQREVEEISENDLIAISYIIHNRLSKGSGIDLADVDQAFRGVGDFSSTCRAAHLETRFKSLSIVAAVFAGLYEDPTHGATRFHRHDQCPDWSRNLRPCALLGPYLYYRD